MLCVFHKTEYFRVNVLNLRPKNTSTTQQKSEIGNAHQQHYMLESGEVVRIIRGKQLDA